jgi:hypothetical protein
VAEPRICSSELDRLNRLFSWMQGESSPAWWRDVVRLQRKRVGDDLKGFIDAGRGPSPAFDRLRSDTYMLFMAIRHVFRYAERFAELSDDPRLSSATAEFLRLAPHAKDLRDFLEHLDEYAVGEGHMHRAGRLDSRDREIHFLLPEECQWDDEIVVQVGENLAPVKTAAHAAMKLAETLVEVQNDELAKYPDALTVANAAGSTDA